MERLQLYISKSLRGFKTLTEINGTESTRRHVRDLRLALEAVTYDSTEKCVFYLMQYVEGATFFTILRTIPDKPLDHLAATIAVPERLLVSADDLYKIIREVTRKVSNPGMNADDIAQLRALLAREYPAKADDARQVPSEGRLFACRSFGGDTGLTLRDFLGDNLYQPMFIPYAGVLLADASLPFRLSGTDLSDMPLSKVVTLLPPERVPDYVPHVFHRVFDRPFKVALGSEVEVVWRRPGFEELVSRITVDADGLRPQTPATDDTRKAISPASFFVTSRSSNDRLQQVCIRVNGREITERHSFTRAELENADVSITAPGYYPYSGRLDLVSTTQALIELAERPKSSSAAATADPEMMRQAAKATRLMDSGYDRGADGKKWWMKLMLMLGGVVLALGLCMLLIPDLFGDSSSEPVLHETTQADTVLPSASIAAMRMEAEAGTEPAAKDAAATEQAQPAAKPAADPVKDAAAAVEFLDGNSTKGWWRQADLAKYPELKGLYDDLNNFNFDALINSWPKKLPSSKWIADIARHAGEAQRKKLDPKSGSHSPVYTGSGKIHRREYINWVNRRQD